MSFREVLGIVWWLRIIDAEISPNFWHKFKERMWNLFPPEKIRYQKTHLGEFADCSGNGHVFKLSDNIIVVVVFFYHYAPNGMVPSTCFPCMVGTLLRRQETLHMQLFSRLRPYWSIDRKGALWSTSRLSMTSIAKKNIQSNTWKFHGLFNLQNIAIFMLVIYALLCFLRGFLLPGSLD